MSKKVSLKPVAAAIGTTFIVSLAASPVVNADDNPFSMTALSNGGYMIAKDAEGKCGEGKCGENMKKKKEEEGKCGEKDEGTDGTKTEGEGKCGS